jgi:hypothetical protein
MLGRDGHRPLCLGVGLREKERELWAG